MSLLKCERNMLLCTWWTQWHEVGSVDVLRCHLLYSWVFINCSIHHNKFLTSICIILLLTTIDIKVIVVYIENDPLNRETKKIRKNVDLKKRRIEMWTVWLLPLLVSVSYLLLWLHGNIKSQHPLKIHESVVSVIRSHCIWGDSSIVLYILSTESKGYFFLYLDFMSFKSCSCQDHTMFQAWANKVLTNKKYQDSSEWHHFSSPSITMKLFSTCFPLESGGFASVDWHIFFSELERNPPLWCHMYTFYFGT